MLFAQSQKLPLTKRYLIVLFGRVASARKSLNPPEGDSSPTQLHNKRDTDISQYLFYGVDKVTILEPDDKKIIANLGKKFDIYHKLILLMKLDTEMYYNIRLIIGLETNINR